MIFVPSTLSAGTITVDGICTLTDAILAANTDMTVGSCSGASGDDTLILDLDIVLSSADVVNSSLFEGSHAGLPDIVTAIQIEAGQGSIIERDSSLGCERGSSDHFRLFNVPAPAGDLTLVGLTLRNGCAAAGGAIALGGSAQGGRILGSTLEGNTSLPDSSNRGGGAILISSVINAFEIRDSIFAENSVLGESAALGQRAAGGALWTTNGAFSFDIVDTVFRANVARGGEGTSGPGGTAEGGAIYMSNAGIDSITLSLFEDNQAIGGSGAVGSPGSTQALGGGGASRPQGPATQAPSGAAGGDAAGGAFYYEGFNTTFDIADCDFRNNRAAGGEGIGGPGGAAEGGALYGTSESFRSLNRSRFEGNSALGGRGDTDGGLADGGALRAADFSAFIVEDLTFMNNRAVGGAAGSGVGGAGSGGAIGWRNLDIGSQINLLHATDNLARGGDSSTGQGGEANGGSISGRNFILFDSLLLRNVAQGGSGAADGRATGGSVEGFFGRLVSTTLAHNLASGGDGTTGPGGGARGGGVSLRRGLLANSVVSANQAVAGDSTAAAGGLAQGGGFYAEPTGSGIIKTDAVSAMIANNLVVGGLGTSNGNAQGGGLQSRGELTFINSILADNQRQVGGAAPIPNDCWMTVPVISGGFNLVEESGPCVFDEPTDQIGIDPDLLPLSSYGCATPVSGGLCPRVHALPVGSPAIDQGLCFPQSTTDARGFSRPWDFPGVPNLDGGCDIGAYEARDEDGNGIEDGTELLADGFETGDLSNWTAAVP